MARGAQSRLPGFGSLERRLSCREHHASGRAGVEKGGGTFEPLSLAGWYTRDIDDNDNVLLKTFELDHLPTRVRIDDAADILTQLQALTPG